jgi:diphthine synthase
MVESASDDILADAQNVDVAFLVVGDPFGYESPPPFPARLKMKKKRINQFKTGLTRLAGWDGLLTV